jgi:hypothetical protein
MKMKVRKNKNQKNYNFLALKNSVRKQLINERRRKKKNYYILKKIQNNHHLLKSEKLKKSIILKKPKFHEILYPFFLNLNLVNEYLKKK